MKKFLTLLGVLLSYYGSAQTTTTVLYNPTSISISNPDRGFYKHTETHSASYSSLNQTTLTNYRLNSNYTLILRVFYLENFVNSPISASYLNSMQADFDKIRNAGLKTVIRFAYSDVNGSSQPQDATKARILEHIQQLKPYLIANVDVITAVQAGFIGSWGEWYYTDHFGMNPTAADYANRKEVVDALLLALPSSRMVQMRTPSLKQKTYLTNAALTDSQAFGTSSVARLGHHNDCFLASADDFGTYTNTSTEYPYLEQETRFTPMGGETCAINLPRSGCTTAINELSRFHWSYLNYDYNAGVIGGFQTNNCFNEIQNRLGYRFEFTTATFPQAATIGGALPIDIKIKNTGFASTFNARTAYLVLRNTVSNQEYSIALAANHRTWAAGTTQNVVENLTLPSNITSGSYKLFLNLPDTDSGLRTRPEYSIRMANETVWESTTGYNDLKHTINIGTSLGVTDNNQLQLQIYPVPANNELVIEYEGISGYNVSLFNSLGQRVDLNSDVLGNKMTLNTQALSNGIYFVQIENGQRKETRKIIVSH